jgi:hypothetical protein
MRLKAKLEAEGFEPVLLSQEHYLRHWTWPTREIAEAEAESVAYVLCRMVGLDAEETSRDYILNWSGQAEVLEASLGNIARAVKQIAKCVGV